MEDLVPPVSELTPAAVLIPIVLRPEGLTVLLTKRTDHLHDHAGQISFPGGRCEPEDGSAVTTALREAEEEVGISPSQVDVLSVLDGYHTSTGYAITPVVGLVRLPLDLKLDDFEVAEVFEPPLAYLLDDQNYRQEQVFYRGKNRAYWSVTWQGRYIWGATAGMLVKFRRALA